MKFFRYIARNARRNPVRSLLTIASMAISLFLMMILVSFLAINEDVYNSVRIYNRLVTMSSYGFSGRVPISCVGEIAALDGIVAATPFAWYGGKYGEETIPFAQFAVDANTIFAIYDELTIPPEQLKAFREDKTGCVIGRKLAEDRGLRVGDPFPLRGDAYPFDLTMTIRGIYDGPVDRDRRMCMFHWSYLDDGLKRTAPAQAGNAGLVVAKCKNSEVLARLSRTIDTMYANSDRPARTQTEEAFGKMFSEMMGDVQSMMRNIGLAVIFSLLCVAGNSMAMSLRERTTEVAVLKAIGFTKPLVVFLVMAEATLVAGLGGVIGTLGCKFLCDTVDMAKYTGGFLPFFYVPWSKAVLGLGISLFIGFWSGFFPAIHAARLSVVSGLRKVG